MNDVTYGTAYERPRFQWRNQEHQEPTSRERMIEEFVEHVKCEQVEVSWTIISLTVLVLGMQMFYVSIGHGPHLSIFYIGIAMLAATIIGMLVMQTVDGIDPETMIFIRKLLLYTRITLLVAFAGVAIWASVLFLKNS